MAWDVTCNAEDSTPAVEAAKIRANWAAIAAGSVPQDGTYVETFFIGKNADNDIKLEADNSDTSNPFIMYDSSENEWVVSHNGTDTTALGAVPSASVLLYIGTSCPTGYTNITATYDNKYIMGAVLASAAVETGGSTTLDISHTHSVPRDGWGAADTAVSGRMVTYASSASGQVLSGATADNTSGSGGSATLTNSPAYAGFLLCQKN